MNILKTVLLFVVFTIGSIFYFKESKGSWELLANDDNRPNIILIMSDDMGYSDLGCYGGEIETPNLDYLADNGVRFSQFYNAARCCPTRASLMTGLYPHQTGIGHMTNVPGDPNSHDLGVPSYRGFLNRNNVTLGELLKLNGYKTYLSGKWHLGMDNENQWPLQRGFDKFYGILAGASNYFKPEWPRGITFNNEQIAVHEDNYYTTDAFTGHAIEFIDESERKENKKPFFLYLAYTAPHWPLQAPKEKISKYLERYKDGWRELRESRYDKMKKLGLIDEGWALTSEDAISWNTLSDTQKEELSLRRAIYAAQVDQMDENIGKLVSHLKDKKLLKNTIIIFLNDNGACAEGGMLGGGNSENLRTKSGYFLSYGQAWANSSNTPYRKYKHWVHEGGISTPMIVHWPNNIDPKLNGKIIDQYGFLPDIMATFVDISNLEYPKEFQGNIIPPMEGKSFLPLLQGQEESIHSEPIFWEHEGNKAVRLGNYKLVMEWKSNEDNNWELYNIEEDRSEINNLSEKEPEKVAHMIEMWNDWAKEKKVLPWDEALNIMVARKTKH
ncbi:arylsulfatase [Arenibacter sp. S6351L]|uniref:arylsulfatase n=1 Tax=Arenibacter sp. S6351L TaxID=2926407 RepID=UPI001FF6BE6D|nr:arylsulfatase [Arenibacter sp. S6351L]MCK0137028.1 arylsulfatase [Arenibacter sp. S6351L]